jgi:hypothetical protein
MSAKCKPQFFQSNKNFWHSSRKISNLLKLYDIRAAIFQQKIGLFQPWLWPLIHWAHQIHITQWLIPCRASNILRGSKSNTVLATPHLNIFTNRVSVSNKFLQWICSEIKKKLHELWQKIFTISHFHQYQQIFQIHTKWWDKQHIIHDKWALWVAIAIWQDGVTAGWNSDFEDSYIIVIHQDHFFDPTTLFEAKK